MKTATIERIPVTEFGKDHASMLAYVECRCVDYKGELDGSHCRVDPVSHPVFGDQGRKLLLNSRSGRLRGSLLRGKEIAPDGHDDVSCLEDLEAEGYVELIGTMVVPTYRLTEKGWSTAERLRKHKSSGGVFANFDWGCS